MDRSCLELTLKVGNPTGLKRWISAAWGCKNDGISRNLTGIRLHLTKRADSAGILVGMASHTLSDSFATRIAELLRRFIEEITPIVDDLENEADEVEV